jgi:hypothetical protein
VTREQLAHVLRTVARISGERDILIIGSQSILGSYPEDTLPARATGSMEVDTAFFADPDGRCPLGHARPPDWVLPPQSAGAAIGLTVADEWAMALSTRGK